MATKTDVINTALRRIKVIAAGDPADAEMTGFAGDTLDALFAEVKDVHGMAFTWSLDATPTAAHLPLAYLLATELAPHYNMPSEPRSRAMMRLRAYAFDNDVTDRRDVNEDGTISEAEANAGKRAAFY